MSRIEDIASRLGTSRLDRQENGHGDGWSIASDAAYLLARIRTLEEALAFYADEANYRKLTDGQDNLEDSDVQLERGSLARTALDGES